MPSAIRLFIGALGEIRTHTVRHFGADGGDRTHDVSL